MDVVEQEKADPIKHRHDLFANKEESAEQPAAPIPPLQRELLEAMRSSMPELKTAALDIKKEADRGEFETQLKIVASDLKDDANRVAKLKSDINSALSRSIQMTDNGKQLLVDVASLHADAFVLRFAGSGLSANRSYGVAFGALGALQGTKDIMRLSRCESLGEAVLPTAGLVADVGVVAGSLSYLSNNPTIAKYRAPFLIGAMVTRLGISAVELTMDCAYPKKAK